MEYVTTNKHYDKRLTLTKLYKYIRARSCDQSQIII